MTGVGGLGVLRQGHSQKGIRVSCHVATTGQSLSRKRGMRRGSNPVLRGKPQQRKVTRGANLVQGVVLREGSLRADAEMPVSASVQ